MKLYTINATPVRSDRADSTNRRRINRYYNSVSDVMLKNGIQGFTMYMVNGFWLGVQEVSFEIKIALEVNNGIVQTIAKELKDMYAQDSVMITEPDNNVIFV